MNMNQKKFIQIGCIVLAAVLLLTGISSVAFVLASPKSQPGAQAKTAAAVDLGYGTVTLVFRHGQDRINGKFNESTQQDEWPGTGDWYNDARGEYQYYRDYVQSRYDAWVSANATTQQAAQTANAAPDTTSPTATDAATQPTVITETETQPGVETANAPTTEPTEATVAETTPAETVPAETTAATEAATESTTAATEAATESTTAATESTTEGEKQEVASQAAPTYGAEAPTVTPSDIPASLKMFEDFTIVVPINASGNIVMPGTDLLSTLAAGNATLTDQALAWQLDAETFWFGDPSDQDALNNAKLWAYSFTGWSASYNGDGNDTRFVNVKNTFQPGDVIVQGSHELKMTDSRYGTLGSSITIENGATIVFDATWGKCNFVRNPYDTMKYKEQKYNNEAYVKYVADTDKCVNADGTKTLKAWDYKDKNGNKKIYDGTIFSAADLRGNLTLNYGNDPNNPISSIDYLYSYCYKYEILDRGYFRYSSFNLKTGDVLAQNAFHRVVMLTGTMDYIKHDKQYHNGYGRDYTLTYYDQKMFTNKCANNDEEYWVVDTYVSATYKSLQASKTSTTGTLHLYRYRQKGLSNSLRGNFRFDNIRMSSITNANGGNANHGTKNLAAELNVAESNQVETAFNWSNNGGNGCRYLETTARFKSEDDGSSGLTIMRPANTIEILKLNGGYFSTVEIAWSGYHDLGTRWWLLGRNVRVGTVRAGTSFAEPEPVYSGDNPQVVKDSTYKLVVTGGTIKNDVSGSSGTLWGYVTGSREMNFHGDPSKSGTQYNPAINGSIYGSYISSVFNNVTINVKNCTVAGSIYGGGYAASANIYGDVAINITNSTVNGSVYGGGYMGNIYQKRSSPFLGGGFGTDPGASSGGGNVKLSISSSDVKGAVYGGGKGGALNNTACTIEAGGASSGWYPENWNDTPIGPRKLGSPAYVPETGAIIYTVYKWGKSISTNNVTMYDYEATVTLSLAIVEKNVTMNISGGHMYQSVYGSGNLGKVMGNVTMSVSNCQVDGDIYGAGDGVTQPGGVTLYSSEKYKEHTYTPPTYTVDSAGKVTFTQQKVDGVVESDGINDKLKVGVFYWSDDPAVLEKGGIDYTKNLIYSPYMTGWGSVVGSTSVSVSGGKVNGSVYGGGNGAKTEVGGSASVTVDGTAVTGYVYGGGKSGEVGQNSSVTFKSGSTGAVYGGGRQAKVGGNSTATISGGTFTYAFGGGLSGEVVNNATLTISGGTFGSNVYGGGDQAGVGGNTTVTVSGGTFGNSVLGGGYSETGLVGGSTTVTIKGNAVLEGYVFGGGMKGDVAQNASVTIEGNAVIKNEVFGGGNEADIGGNTTVTLKAGPKICNSGEESVYGGGNKGAVGGNSTVNINGLDSSKNVMSNGAIKPWAVFGGGNEGVVSGDVVVNMTSGHLANLFGGAKRADIGGEVTVNISGGKVVYGYGANCYEGDITGDVVVNMTAGTIGDRLVGCGWKADYTGDSYLNISGGTVGKNVFGGGEEAAAHNVHVSFSGGTVTEYIYGGGMNGEANDVYLEISGGTVGKSVFGGGLNGEANDVHLEISGGTITKNIYGGAQNAHTNSVYLEMTNGATDGIRGGGYNGTTGDIHVEVSGGSIFSNIYGGGENGSSGDILLNVSGGVGGTSSGGLSGGFIFGGGAKAAVGNIELNLSGGEYNYVLGGGDGSLPSGASDVNGNIVVNITGNPLIHGFYRGGSMRNSTVYGSITTNMSGGTIESGKYCFAGGCHGIDYYTDSNLGAQTHVLGKITANIVGGTIKGAVYGGSLGPYNYTNNATALAAVDTDCNDIELNISGSAQINGSVYCATAAADVLGNVVANIGGPVTVNGTTYRANGLLIKTDIYGGNNLYGDVHGNSATPITVNMYGGTVNGNVYGGNNVGGKIGGGVESVDTVLNVCGGTVKGSVYGGSKEVNTSNVATNVTISNTNNTAVAIAISGSVFGGGYNGEASSTNVKLQNTSSCAAITVGGDVFGGGKGSMGSSGTTARVRDNTSVLIDLYTNLTATETQSSLDDISGQAKVTPSITEKNKITGSVYGGGDIAQVGVGIINRGSNSATVTEPGTTHVEVKSGNILGSVFGGGNGVPASGTYDVDMGTVFGSTHVDITGGYVHTNVYGGGRQSHLYAPSVDNVAGQASQVHIDQTGNGTIVIGGSVFGGGDRGEGTSLNAAAPTVVGNTDVRITGNPTNCKVYFIQGGVYGDGNLCVVKGTRTITMKDFTTGSAQYLKTFFSLQRADKVVLDNTDIVLQGALDLVDEGDATLYSVNRVDALEMKNGSTMKLTSIVKYLGALSSDVEPTREFIKAGNNNTNGYTDEPPASPLTQGQIDAYRADTGRNKNTVCVANGLYLEVIRQSDGEYGPITGLYTLQLLRAVPGEGGGFVYADIATSTGDFICETKKTGSNVYLEVVDDVGDVVNGQGSYYFWYIAGETISYSTTVNAYIGMADTAFSSTFYIPEHKGQTLQYVLKDVTGNDTLRNAITGTSPTYTLVARSGSLSGKEIAIELTLDGTSLGFLQYNGTDWYVKVNDKSLSGYDAVSTQIGSNVLAAMEVGEGKGKAAWVLHKSTSVDSELRGMHVSTEIDLFHKSGESYTPYTAGTGVLVLGADLNVVRLNPSQSFYRVDSRFFGQGISPDKEVSITGKSAFTVEFHTAYVPLAYPGTMTWALKTTENRYYLSRQGGWVTTDAEGNVIAYSGNTKPTRNSATEYVAGSETFALQSTGSPVSNALPKGTKIIMVDATGGSREYYYYLVTENNGESTIDLRKFCLMGTKTMISAGTAPDFMAVYDNKTSTRVDETLFFIFDFSQVTWANNNTFTGGVVLEHMYNGLDIMDHVKVNQSGTSISYVRDFPEAAKYQVNPGTDAVEGLTATAVGGEHVTLTVQVERDSTWTNTQFNEQQYALRIEWMDGNAAQNMPNGLYATYGGRDYYPGSGNMDLVVPLSISETSYTSTHEIRLDSVLGALAESLNTSGTLRVTLYNAANGSFYNQMTTGLSATTSYTLNAQPETALAVACTNDNRIFSRNEVMQFKYKTVGSTENVTVKVYKKTDGKYGEVALSSVFSNATATMAPGSDISKSWTVAGNAGAGTYRVAFQYADRTEYMNIIIQ